MNPSHLPYRRLVAALFGTLKLMQMYGREHDATAEALGNLATAVHGAAEGEEEMKISVRGNRLQVNDRTMRAAECGTLALGFLAGELVRREIEGLRLAAQVDPDALGIFAAAFLELDLTQPAPAERLIGAVQAAGIEGIVIEKREERQEDPILLEDRRDSAMRTYLRGLRAFKDVLRCDGFRDRTRIRRARRAVQGLVDHFLEDESAVLALAQIRGHDLKLFHHSLNVCVFALCIGQRLGMTRRQLGELGLAALFHDLGKTVVPPAGAAEGALQWRELRRHPSRGARLILEEGTSHEGMLKAAIAAYEHHVHYDKNGFPDVDHVPHLISRIVSIADCYESLTSASSFRETPYAPYDAFSLMKNKSGTLFDPLLLKVFVGALGIHPVGSLVELSTGETAIVTAGPAEPGRISLPHLRVVATGSGELELNETVDLSEADEAGVACRTITRSVPANEFFASAGEHVSAI